MSDDPSNVAAGDTTAAAGPALKNNVNGNSDYSHAITAGKDDTDMTDSPVQLHKEDSFTNASSANKTSTFSPATEEILRRVSANAQARTSTGNAGWEAARKQVLDTMTTTDGAATHPIAESSKRGRGVRFAHVNGGDSTTGSAAMDVTSSAPQQSLEPTSTPSRGRGRGRGTVRARGRGRGGRGGGRGGRRKQDADIIKTEKDDSDSENYELSATTTKSGRNVQKPTSFVPPAPSPSQPTTGVKRKRHFNKRNPESTVCKICMRPHSPATNMIVFCDGCNAPYHRYCHHPPIDQQVVDVPEKEWYCAECTADPAFKVEPDISLFVSGAAMTEQQVRSPLLVRSMSER